MDRDEDGRDTEGERSMEGERGTRHTERSEEEKKGERGWPGGGGWGGTQTAGDGDSQRGAGTPRRRDKGDPGTETPEPGETRERPA